MVNQAGLLLSIGVTWIHLVYCKRVSILINIFVTCMFGASMVIPQLYMIYHKTFDLSGVKR